MVAMTEEEFTVEVKHIKDIIEFWKSWNTGDRFEGDGEWEQRTRLLHVYESEDKIFKVTTRGVVVGIEDKK